jgi:hypothetical protein
MWPVLAGGGTVRSACLNAIAPILVLRADLPWACGRETNAAKTAWTTGGFRCIASTAGFLFWNTDASLAFRTG